MIVRAYAPLRIALALYMQSIPCLSFSAIHVIPHHSHRWRARLPPTRQVNHKANSIAFSHRMTKALDFLWRVVVVRRASLLLVCDDTRIHRYQMLKVGNDLFLNTHAPQQQNKELKEFTNTNMFAPNRYLHCSLSAPNPPCPHTYIHARLAGCLPSCLSVCMAHFSSLSISLL